MGVDQLRRRAQWQYMPATQYGALRWSRVNGVNVRLLGAGLPAADLVTSATRRRWQRPVRCSVGTQWR